MGDVQFTDREREIVGCVVRGMSDKEIARRLGISRETVRTHIEKAAAKIPGKGLRPRPKLYAWWAGQIEGRRSIPENGDGDAPFVVANVG